LQDIYLVGTEEGNIHKCTVAYDSVFLASYPAHTAAVYAVRWNPLHARTFLSVGADAFVRLWDEAKPEKVGLESSAD